LPIREHEIAVILALTNEGEVIGFSEIYREGDAIRVVKGPLEGQEGLIESYDHRKKRIKIQIGISGRTKKVDLGAEMVVKQV
jgi:transcriptional antiterminator NusG